ncbi:MAG: YdjY domain-containing protein [Planctomycetota bacterium]
MHVRNTIWTAILAAGVMLSGCAGSSDSVRTGDAGTWNDIAAVPTTREADAPVEVVAEVPPVSEPTARAESADEPAWVEALPGVRINRAQRRVAFDGFVPIDTDDLDAPRVYLEVVVCALDTKEHESLVATRVPASSIHAALLSLGYEPGAPGDWDWDGADLNAEPPTGDALEVWLIPAGGEPAPALSWVVSTQGARLDDGFVFAGSRERTIAGQTVYEADGSGTIVGLHTFGGEAIALERVMSHDSTIEEPEWIADNDAVPPFGTAVTVELRPAG